MMLTTLIALPIVGALVLLAFKDDEAHEAVIRNVALAVSVVAFGLTLLLWARFDPAAAGLRDGRAGRARAGAAMPGCRLSVAAFIARGAVDPRD